MSVLNTGLATPSRGYDIDQSLRFDDGASAYLSTTLGTATHNDRLTFSCWVKRSAISENHKILTRYTDGQNRFYIGISNNDKIYIYQEVGGAQNIYLRSSVLYRDPSAWYHFVFAFDTTQGTDSNRIKVYANGTQITDWENENYPSQNTDLYIQSATSELMKIGQYDSSQYLDGYLAEVHFIDGTALTPSSFGETGDYGEWKPIKVSGLTYGTNGFYLNFENESTKHTITAVGNAQHTTSVTKVGASTIAFDGTGDYLEIPASNAFEVTGDFTIEFWLKRNSSSNPSHEEYFISNLKDPEGFYIYWQTNGTIYIGQRVNGSEKYKGFAPGVDTDWHHLALVRSAGTYTFYWDGVTQTITYDNMPTSYGTEALGTSTDTMRIGYKSDPVSDRYWDGHMDEIRISNMARYTSGFTPSTSAFTEDGNTLLLIHSNTTNGSTTFTDSSGVSNGLGTDSSGEGNDWTANNLSASDQMLDTPTNNFATLNPLHNNGGSFAEGNLKYTDAGSNGWDNSKSTLGVSSGKWYWELFANTLESSHRQCASIAGESASLGYLPGQSEDMGVTYYSNGNKYFASDSNGVSYGASWATGDVISIALDMDASGGKVYFAKNGVWQNSGDPVAGTGYAITGFTNYDDVYFAQSGHYFSGSIQTFNFGQDSSFAGNKTAQGNADSRGKGDFYYTPPSGFLALCTANLPNVAVKPSQHFNTVLYTGNNSTNAITGVGFRPDFVWTKSRSNPYNHDLYDAVRGTGRRVQSNRDRAELTIPSNTIESFDSDGFTVGASDNGNYTGNSVSWNWRANGSGSANSNGSTNSTVSANTDAGFSIVSYTGTGSNATVGHGLSVAPEMVIVKSRSSVEDWICYTEATGNTGYLPLNATSAFSSSSTMFNNTSPTASLFTVGTNNATNSNTQTYIAYCFHSVDGYSKMGSYEGNSNADGTFVYLGFRPAFVMWKKTNDADDWGIHDNKREESTNANPLDNYLRPNEIAGEGDDGDSVDFLSNGFKWRINSGLRNNSGDTYIYLAFAEQPFKYSNAR